MELKDWKTIYLIAKANRWALDGMDLDKSLGDGLYRECIKYWRKIMADSWRKIEEDAETRCT